MQDRQISIHALLAESDRNERPETRPSYISIHALLAESDNCTSIGRPKRLYFYPRSPCGERRWLRCWKLAARDISIHALLAESDTRRTYHKDENLKFLSTLSLRRATMNALKLARPMLFLSTLSLRRATAKVHKTVGHFCAYETNFMGIASSC